MNDQPPKKGSYAAVHDPAVYRYRDMAVAWVQREGMKHYNPNAFKQDECHFGMIEMGYEAETAQRLLDHIDIPDGPPQGGGDLDTRVAALALRVIDAEALLSKIAHAHVQGQVEGGMVDGICVECDRQWPCPTYRHAMGQRHHNATWNPDDQDDEDCPQCGWMPEFCGHGEPSAKGSLGVNDV
jgi:hypothetical protein